MLHHQLTKKCKWYKKWHKQEHCHHFHWLTFVLVFLIASLAVVSAWQITLDEEERLILELSQVKAQTVSGDQVANPGFEGVKEGMPKYWSYYSDVGGNELVRDSQYKTEGLYSAKITFQASGSNIQLFQFGFVLEPRATYRLSFDAYSSSGNDLRVRMHKHVYDYGWYGLDYVPNLTSGWQRYTTTFTSNSTGIVADARLAFSFHEYALPGDIYYIDNIEFIKIADGPVVPVAEAGGPYTVSVGQPLQFDGSASYAPVGSITSYQWTFGDGSTGTGQNPSHAYSQPGVYTALLVVTNSAGATEKDYAAVVVGIPTTPGAFMVNGKLAVQGTNLVNNQGTPIQLRGTGGFHSVSTYSCMNEGAVAAMAREWGVDVVRIPVNPGDDAYNRAPEWWEAWADDLVEAAYDEGIYAIVDWHQVVWAGNPNTWLTQASTFFDHMASRHAWRGNVIYEIANEPQTDWNTIVSYAEQIIPIIRAYDPDGVIIVGTPYWSAHPDWVDPPLTGSLGHNVMYAYHYYQGGDIAEDEAMLRQESQRIPIMLTEWGHFNAAATSINVDQGYEWVSLMSELGLSWMNWAWYDWDWDPINPLEGNVCPLGPFTATANGELIKEWLNNPPDSWSGAAPTDTIPPNVNSFSVSPATSQTSFTINWQVSDNNSLNRVEVWRVADNNGVPGDWGTIPLKTISISGTSQSGSTTDSPAVGTWWYGLHVVDSVNLRDTEPNPPGPTQVVKTTASQDECATYPGALVCENFDDRSVSSPLQIYGGAELSYCSANCDYTADDKGGYAVKGDHALDGYKSLAVLDNLADVLNQGVYFRYWVKYAPTYLFPWQEGLYANIKIIKFSMPNTMEGNIEIAWDDYYTIKMQYKDEDANSPGMEYYSFPQGLTKGEWHKLEFYMRIPDTGTSNSVIHLQFDDQDVINSNTFYIRKPGSAYSNVRQFSSVRASNLPPAGQGEWALDDITVVAGQGDLTNNEPPEPGGEEPPPPTCADNDNDGYSASSCGGTDCNDSNAAIHPGATEVCNDSIDNDCDGSVDENCGTPPTGTNLIQNGDFEQGTNYWIRFSGDVNDNPTNASIFEVVPGQTGNAAHYIVTQELISTDNVQLFQRDISLTAGQTYRLSFDARSTPNGPNMDVVVHQHASPFTNYGLSQPVSLTTSWNSYTYTFRASGFTGTTNDARLRFWFVPYAGTDDEYWIDNVVLRAVNPPLYVVNIEVQPRPLWRVFSIAKAIITVRDLDGNPVPGVRVSSHWSGITTDQDSKLTNSQGEVTIYSNLNWLARGDFVIEVDNLERTGYEYDPAGSSETSDSAPYY